jgi:hypothetical protein
MKKNIKFLFSASFLFFISFLFITPFFVSAQQIQEGTGKYRGGIIPCGIISPGADTATIKAQECTFSDLLILGQNIIKYLIFISIPIAAIAFAWAGFLYLTSGGETGKISKAKGIFWNVMLGFIFILTAWLLVYTATSFLSDGFNFLIN